MFRGFISRQSQVVSSLPMAIFRITYAAVLLADLIDMWRWRRVYFEDWAVWLVPIWAVAVVMLGVGLWSRWAALLNFGLGVIVLYAIRPFTYHADVVVLTVNFLLLFVPLSGRLSVEAWRGTARDGVVRFAPNLILFIGVGLFYFDSVLWKLGSETWRSGLGVWRPAAMPQLTSLNLGPILDNHPLVLVLGYGVLAFEGLFLILMWIRPLRPWLLAAGCALHLGIGIVFRIPLFGLFFVALMMLLLPDRELGRQAEVRPLLVLAGGLTVIQAVSVLQVPWLGVPLSALDRAKSFTTATAPLIGIQPHPLFLDQHLYDLPFQRVEEDGRLLPFSQPDGTPGPWLMGRRYGLWLWAGPISTGVADRLIDRFLGPGHQWVYSTAHVETPPALGGGLPSVDLPADVERAVRGRLRE